MEEDFVHIQLLHDPQHTRGSDRYEPEVEAALGRLGLPELFGPSEESREGTFHRETGPEIIALASSLVGLATAIVSLVTVWKEHHAEAEVNIQVVVRSPEEVEQIVNARRYMKFSPYIV
jgi:hypothetical protein